VGHTADVKFIAYGNTFEELFTNSALALFGIVSDTNRVVKSGARTKQMVVRVRADSMKVLLWRFLQACLSKSDVHRVYPYAVISLSISNGKAQRLDCRLACKDMNEEDSRLEAKGVSKYDLDIGKRAGRFAASVVVDV